jgi:carbon-monoxide dehydrogenase small subunit
MSDLQFTVNGRAVTVEVEPRESLLDVLRYKLGLTGAHAGCEQGVCGACTVFLDGQTIRSCLMFGIQAAGCEVVTIEGLAPSAQELHPVQEAFRQHHGLQCGFCTPGMVLAAVDLLEQHAAPTDEQINDAMSGNICRCTGYTGIIDAVRDVSRSAQTQSETGLRINGSGAQA